MTGVLIVISSLLVAGQPRPVAREAFGKRYPYSNHRVKGSFGDFQHVIVAVTVARNKGLNRYGHQKLKSAGSATAFAFDTRRIGRNIFYRVRNIVGQLALVQSPITFGQLRIADRSRCRQ